MSHAKRVTRDNWKNPEYHVIAALRNLRTDTNCPAGKSWPNHVKNEQHIGYIDCIRSDITCLVLSVAAYLEDKQIYA